VCIILLQIITVVIWYNETANEQKISKAFEAVTTANKATDYTERMNGALLQSQVHFNHYIENKDQSSLNNYLISLKETSAVVDSLKLTTSNQTAFKNLLSKRNQVVGDIVVLKQVIDATLDKQLEKQHQNIDAPIAFTELNYNKVLDSIKTNTFIKVDNIARKGLVRRLIAAFSGKVQIQKEQLNTVVTMKYKDKIITGTIEQLLKNVILNTNKYYALEFKKLKYTFLNLRHKDVELIKCNNELLLLSHTIMPDYTAAAQAFKTDSNQLLKEQYHTNKSVRNYTIAALILLMLVVSVILFGFTRLAFEYEQRLVKAQDKIRENLNFKNRIMGMISHEIRSPLSILSIYSKKIGATVEDDSVKETFKSIQFTTDSLLLLSNQILEYSRDENYQPELKAKNFNLKTEIDQIITTLTSLVASNGNKIMLKDNLKNDIEVCSDSTKIHQLFYNIIGNANKFTENGCITVTIQQEALSEYEYNLNVAIKDNGMGIAANDLEHIFESHFQGTVSENVQDLGIGLGLNLCKEIVSLFDGDISVTSKENEGTTVAFNLILSKV
jgi:signal transduction histidine kinase